VCTESMEGVCVCLHVRLCDSCACVKEWRWHDGAGCVCHGGVRCARKAWKGCVCVCMFVCVGL